MSTTEQWQFAKVGAGRYNSADGRYTLVALQGWYRGTWALFDHQTRTKRDFGSKREAETALRAEKRDER
jgi:hypothetical protein